MASRFRLMLIRGLFKAYRWTLSPIFIGFGAGCRFHPSCSEYAALCFERFDTWTALKLSTKRLCKCHPLGGDGGCDPVPEKTIS